MASTKKERREKKRASRNKRELRKIVRYIRQVAKAKRLIITAKRGDFSFTSPSSARNIMFNHRPEAHIETVMRFPNKKEKYEEIMCVLRSMYYFGNFSMKRNAYYTLKAMAHKNPEDPCVMNFIKKHDMNSYTRLMKTFNTETPYTETIFRLNLGDFSTTCITTVYINKEEKVDEYNEDCIMINGGGDGNENKETENSGKEKEDSDKRIEKA